MRTHRERDNVIMYSVQCAASASATNMDAIVAFHFVATKLLLLLLSVIVAVRGPQYISSLWHVDTIL